MTFFHPFPIVLNALSGNEPQIARKLNVADIEYKDCEYKFVPMWRSRLADSSEEMSHAGAREGFVELLEEEGLLVGERSINKYRFDRDEQWVAAIGFENLGVIVLDTKKIR